MQRRAIIQNFLAGLFVILVGIGLAVFAQSPSAAGQIWRHTPPPEFKSANLVKAVPTAAFDDLNSDSATIPLPDVTQEPMPDSRDVAAVPASETELPSALPTGESVTVARVVDGDTIELATGQKVRYIGMDTPEATGGHWDCFGQQATTRNAELVLGKTVQLTRDVSETDRYGRLLRFVWLDGQLINDTLVREGYAHAATFPPDVARSAQFVAAEREARQAGRGLWSGCPGGNTRSDYDTSVPQASRVDCPSGRPIKGNAQSQIYHLPGQKYYSTTRPEACFATEVEAKAAGYRKAKI